MFRLPIIPGSSLVPNDFPVLEVVCCWGLSAGLAVLEGVCALFCWSGDCCRGEARVQTEPKSKEPASVVAVATREKGVVMELSPVTGELPRLNQKIDIKCPALAASVILATLFKSKIKL
jgi:hypothetical protein